MVNYLLTLAIMSFMNKNIIIIGGGASALMLTSLLPKSTVTVIESNEKLGAKILVSGGGKCNITNTDMGTEYFLGDENFVQPALFQYSGLYKSSRKA